MPHSQDASNSAGKRHCGGIYKERGFQIRSRLGGLLHETYWDRPRLLQIPGTALQRLPKDSARQPRRYVVPPFAIIVYILSLHSEVLIPGQFSVLGTFVLTHVDEFVEELLSEERSCDVILPRIQKRSVLEENNQLETRVSALEEDLDAIVESGSEEEEFYMEGSKTVEDVATPHDGDKKRDRGKSRSRSKSPGGHHRRDKKRRNSRERERGDRGERDRPRHR